MKVKVLVQNPPSLNMAGTALKGFRDFVSMMAPQEVSLKEKCSRRKRGTFFVSQKLREILRFRDF